MTPTTTQRPVPLSATSTAHAIPTAKISSVQGSAGSTTPTRPTNMARTDERGVDHGQTGSGLPSTCSVSSHRRAAVAGSFAEA